MLSTFNFGYLRKFLKNPATQAHKQCRHNGRAARHYMPAAHRIQLDRDIAMQ